MELILYAVPGFFALIFLELMLEKWRGTHYYRVNDALTSLATGAINQLVNVSSKLIPFTVYVLLFEHIAVFNFEASIWTWIAAFVLYDFFYYWNHRMGHEMNILWAAHVVHHSSEEYNLSTALRQTGTGFLSFVFYLPMAVLGFDPVMVLTVGALNLIYQFWVHTRHIGKLGWFEWVFVTPSNHRGHHAQNTIYIDRNYGGVFILWDRLFGTYQEEKEDDLPVFGIRGAVQSWNPLWVNFQIYNQLFWDAVHTRNWWHKIAIWFKRTGWRPPDVVERYPLKKNELEDFVKFDTTVSPALKAHCILHYVTTAAIVIYFSIAAPEMTVQERLFVSAFVLLSGFAIGALMENRHFAGTLEWIRITTMAIVAALAPIPLVLSIGLCAAALLSMPLLFLGRRQALRDSLSLGQAP